MADSEKMIDGFEVTVRGQLYLVNGKDRTTGTYGPVTFFLPPVVELPNGKKKVEKIVGGKKTYQWVPQTKKSSVTVENVANYVVQRRLLPDWIAEHFPNASGHRTCHVIPGGIKPAKRPASEVQSLDKPLAQMSVTELKIYCKLHGLIVELSGFSKAQDAYQAVQMALDEKKEADRKAALPPEEPAEPRDPNAPPDSSGVLGEEEEAGAKLFE